MNEVASTLPSWVTTITYVLVLLVFAGLVFWFLATVVRRVFNSFKKDNLKS